VSAERDCAAALARAVAAMPRYWTGVAREDQRGLSSELEALIEKLGVVQDAGEAARETGALPFDPACAALVEAIDSGLEHVSARTAGTATVPGYSEVSILWAGMSLGVHALEATLSALGRVRRGVAPAESAELVCRLPGWSYFATPAGYPLDSRQTPWLLFHTLISLGLSVLVRVAATRSDSEPSAFASRSALETPWDLAVQCAGALCEARLNANGRTRESDMSRIERRRSGAE